MWFHTPSVWFDASNSKWTVQRLNPKHDLVSLEYYDTESGDASRTIALVGNRDELINALTEAIKTLAEFQIPPSV